MIPKDMQETVPCGLSPFPVKFRLPRELSGAVEHVVSVSIRRDSSTSQTERFQKPSQVTKVKRCNLDVEAMTRPMLVREDPSPYGGSAA